MKSVYKFIFFLILLLPVILFSQNETDSTKTVKFSERIPAELELEVKVNYTGAIGYANLFRGKVLEVTRGTMTDTSILISVLPGDTAVFNKLCYSNEVLKLSFMFNKSGEKYSTTFITGFVDSEKNSWKLIGIEKSK